MTTLITTTFSRQLYMNLTVSTELSFLWFSLENNNLGLNWVILTFFGIQLNLILRPLYIDDHWTFVSQTVFYWMYTSLVKIGRWSQMDSVTWSAQIMKIGDLNIEFAFYFCRYYFENRMDSRFFFGFWPDAIFFFKFSPIGRSEQKTISFHQPNIRLTI